MEKEFIWFLTTELVSDTKDQPTTDQSASRALSEIEKNAVRYTGGYVIRKLEQNFSTKKINLKQQLSAPWHYKKWEKNWRGTKR